MDVVERSNPENIVRICLNLIERYLGRGFESENYENPDTEKSCVRKVISYDPSLDLKNSRRIDFDKRIHNMTTHYNGSDLKGFRHLSFHSEENPDRFFETIVSDPNGVKDEVLYQFLSSLRQKYAPIRISDLDREKLRNSTIDLACKLSVEVYDFFGGHNQNLDELCNSKIKSLQKKRDRNINQNWVYLGELKGCGVCRHQSILFKVVCDMFHIPCRILRGYYLDKTNEKQPEQHHVWNEVRIIDKNKSHTVDIIDCRNFPGEKEIPEKIKSRYITHIESDNGKTLDILKKLYHEKKGVKIGTFTNTTIFEFEIKSEVDDASQFFVLKEMNITHMDKRARRKNSLDRVKREIETMKQCRHPNIAEAIGSFETENERREKIVCIAMKKYDYNGMDFLDELDNLIEVDTKTTKGELLRTIIVLQFLIEVSKGLEHIHNNRIIHYDIKPENILIRWDSERKHLLEVVISDFGSVKDMYLSSRHTTLPPTTGGYRAPEIEELLDEVLKKEVDEREVENHSFSHKSDIYSFGRVMEDFRNFLVGYSKVEESIQKCLEKEPSDRPSLFEVRNHLKDALGYIRALIYENYLEGMDAFTPTRNFLMFFHQEMRGKRELIRGNFDVDVFSEKKEFEQAVMRKVKDFDELEEGLKQMNEKFEKHKLEAIESSDEKDRKISQSEGEKKVMEKNIETLRSRVETNYRRLFFLTTVLLVFALLFLILYHTTIFFNERKERSERVCGELESVNAFTLVGKGGEAHAWHDSLKTDPSKDWVLTFTVLFEGYNRDAVGRHGGVHIFGNKTDLGVRRGGVSGIVDWIDRTSDRGFRVYGSQMEGTPSSPLNLRTEISDSPDGDWTIMYKARYQKVVFLFNGSVVHEFKMKTEFSGLGFWCWGGNRMKVTKLKVTTI